MNAPQPKLDGIASNLSALRELFAEAARRSEEGYLLLQEGEEQEAMVILLDIGEMLVDAKALYGAMLAIRRWTARSR